MNINDLQKKTGAELKQIAKSLKINPMQKSEKLIQLIIEKTKKVETIANEFLDKIEVVIEKVDDTIDLTKELVGKIDKVLFDKYIREAFNSKLSSPIFPDYHLFCKQSINTLDELSVWIQKTYLKR